MVVKRPWVLGIGFGPVFILEMIKQRTNKQNTRDVRHTLDSKLSSFFEMQSRHIICSEFHPALAKCKTSTSKVFFSIEKGISRSSDNWNEETNIKNASSFEGEKNICNQSHNNWQPELSLVCSLTWNWPRHKVCFCYTQIVGIGGNLGRSKKKAKKSWVSVPSSGPRRMSKQLAWIRKAKFLVSTLLAQSFPVRPDFSPSRALY